MLIVVGQQLARKPFPQGTQTLLRYTFDECVDFTELYSRESRLPGAKSAMLERRRGQQRFERAQNAGAVFIPKADFALSA